MKNENYTSIHRSYNPFCPEVQYANEKVGPLTIKVYPGADGSFTFYDDERDNYNYEKGAYATIAMQWDEASQTLILDKQSGSYEGMPQSRKISIVKVGKGMPYNDPVHQEITYKGEKMEIKLD